MVLLDLREDLKPLTVTVIMDGNENRNGKSPERSSLRTVAMILMILSIPVLLLAIVLTVKEFINGLENGTSMPGLIGILFPVGIFILLAGAVLLLIDRKRS